MSTSQMLGHDPNLDSLRNEILNRIDESIARLDTYQYSEAPSLPETNLVSKPISEYFSNQNIIPAVRAFHDLARTLLVEFRNFIQNCTDAETLEKAKSGINSFMFDFRRFQTIKDIDDASNRGERTDLQSASDLNEAIANITAQNVNIPQLLIELQANQVAIKEIVEVIMSSTEGFPTGESGEIDEKLKDLYLRFREMLKSINSNLSVSQAIIVLSEFITAVKFVSDQTTNPYVADLFSNIFNRLASYYTAADLGSYYVDEDQSN